MDFTTSLWRFFIEHTQQIGVLVVLIIPALQCYYIYGQRKQLEVASSSELSRIFIEVSSLWNKQYENRVSILTQTPPTIEDLEKEFPQPEQLLNSEDWQKTVKPLLNFFEFLGVLVSDSNLKQNEIRDRIFTLVTVDTYPDWDGNAETIPLIEDGKIYASLAPYLSYLREQTVYRRDVYNYYDKHLLPKWREFLIEKSSPPKPNWFVRFLKIPFATDD